MRLHSQIINCEDILQKYFTYFPKKKCFDRKIWMLMITLYNCVSEYIISITQDGNTVKFMFQYFVVCCVGKHMPVFQTHN